MQIYFYAIFLATIIFHVTCTCTIYVLGVCDKPVAPANGSINSTGIMEGDTVTYFCNKGYYLSGDPIRTCQSDGKWSGEQPKCIGMWNTSMKCIITEFYTLYSLCLLCNIQYFPSKWTIAQACLN